MKIKIIGILVVTLLISAAVLPVAGTMNIDKKIIEKQTVSSADEPSSSMSTTDWWSMFRHDLQHSGYSTSSAPNTNKILWSYITGYRVISSPAVVDGKVYFGSEDNNVYCLHANNGTKIWNYTTGNWVRSSPAVADGMVYIGSLDGKVYCLYANNGTKKWSYTTGGEVRSSPAVADSKVYVGSNDWNVYCLYANNGTKKWSYKTNERVRSSPAVVDGMVYIGSLDMFLYCLYANNGTKKWGQYLEALCVHSSPAVVDGMVYVGSLWDTPQIGKVHCLYANNGTKKWGFLPNAGVYSSPAVVDGMVYIGSVDNNVYCLYANNGTKKWSYTTGDEVKSSPAVADGKVYIGSYDKKVYCLYANNGTKIWSYQTGDWVYSSPAVADGKVYVGSHDGIVYAFGNDPPTAPDIKGPPSGDVGVEYCCTFHSDDPDGDNIKYIIDWGDGTTTETECEEPCTPVEACHTYTKQGKYTIKAMAKECTEDGLESEESTFEVTIPRNRAINTPFLRLLENYPNLFLILRLLLQRLGLQ